MKEYCEWMDSLPRVGQLVLCIWILDITWAIYRIGGAIVNKNWLHLILAILWIVAAGTVGWVLDLVWIILFHHIFWFNESK